MREFGRGKLGLTGIGRPRASLRAVVPRRLPGTVCVDQLAIEESARVWTPRRVVRGVKRANSLVQLLGGVGVTLPE